MGEVRALKEKTIAVNPGMVEMVEHLLADVKAGKVLELVIVTHLRGREIGSGFCVATGEDGGSIVTLIGAVETMKAKLVNEWLHSK